MFAKPLIDKIMSYRQMKKTSEHYKSDLATSWGILTKKKSVGLLCNPFLISLVSPIRDPFFVFLHILKQPILWLFGKGYDCRISVTYM